MSKDFYAINWYFDGSGETARLFHHERNRLVGEQSIATRGNLRRRMDVARRAPMPHGRAGFFGKKRRGIRLLHYFRRLLLKAL